MTFGTTHFGGTVFLLKVAVTVFAALIVTEHEPAEQPPWRPGSEVPAKLADLVGLWYSEGSPFVFSVRQGRLEARAQGLPEHKPSSVFVEVGEDLYRTESGREAGELLRVTRDASGRVAKMNWATYLVTRQPYRQWEPFLKAG